MSTTSSPLSPAEIVGRLPSAAEICLRLDQIERERKALIPLLRAARAAERKQPTVSGTSDGQNGGAV